MTLDRIGSLGTDHPPLFPFSTAWEDDRHARSYGIGGEGQRDDQQTLKKGVQVCLSQPRTTRALVEKGSLNARDMFRNLLAKHGGGLWVWKAKAESGLRGWDSTVIS